MMLDGHMHIAGGEIKASELLRQMRSAGIGGGIFISLPPASFPYLADAVPNAARLENLMGWVAEGPECFPFYWIDPLETDALRQVNLAVGRGVRGFKIICNHFYPGDERAMPVYRAIAAAGRPILFHSGILWDGAASSKYNRPVCFEELIEVEGLRFALAHISWPWCDELIAVYGKFLNTRRRRADLGSQMFVDLTPGTPKIYRKDALTKLSAVYPDVTDSLLFGSDSETDGYNSESVKSLIARDTEIFRELGLSQPAIDPIFRGNLRRFLSG